MSPVHTPIRTHSPTHIHALPADPVSRSPCLTNCMHPFPAHPVSLTAGTPFPAHPVSLNVCTHFPAHPNSHLLHAPLFPSIALGCVYTTIHGQFSVFSPAFLFSFSCVYTITADPRWSPFVSFSCVHTGERIRKSSSCDKYCHGSTNHTQGIVENRPQNNTCHMTKIVKTHFLDCRIRVNGRKRNKHDGKRGQQPFRLFTHSNLSGRTFPFSNSSTLASVLVFFRFGVQLLCFAPRTV